MHLWRIIVVYGVSDVWYAQEVGVGKTLVRRAISLSIVDSSPGVLMCFLVCVSGTSWS